LWHLLLPCRTPRASCSRGSSHLYVIIPLGCRKKHLRFLPISPSFAMIQCAKPQCHPGLSRFSPEYALLHALYVIESPKWTEQLAKCIARCSRTLKQFLLSAPSDCELRCLEERDKVSEPFRRLDAMDPKACEWNLEDPVQLKDYETQFLRDYASLTSCKLSHRISRSDQCKAMYDNKINQLNKIKSKYTYCLKKDL
jgi:hypothetical protein